MARLATAVQELSLVCDLKSIASIVKRYAREFSGADGTTFVLRAGELCFYMDEDAVSPLWKGQRFPMSSCVSGWVMLHGVPAIIPDIYADSRVPFDAYRPTFVKSLLMTPIRRQDPLGAIGAYWATPHTPSVEEVTILAALADSTAVALQNIQLQNGLCEIRERAEHLALSNRELDAFSSSVSHDLRSPLRTISQYSQLLLEEKKAILDAEAIEWLGRISATTRRMSAIVDDLLRLASISQKRLHQTEADLSRLALEAVSDLGGQAAVAKCTITEGLTAFGDTGLLRLLLENLLSNALKYSSRSPEPKVEFGRAPTRDGQQVFFVRDNGIGIDPQAQTRLFQPFERLHRDPGYQGVGLGLATVKRIVDRHQGKVWVESAPGAGATFFFSLPAA